jgi:hypothetical protein
MRAARGDHLTCSWRTSSIEFPISDFAPLAHCRHGNNYVGATTGDKSGVPHLN